MAISPESLGTQRPGTMSRSSESLNSKTNGHSADAAINGKTNGKMNGLTNGHAAHIITASAPPKTSVDTSAQSTDANSDVTVVDFTGDVNTNNEIPTQKVLKSVADMPLLDKDGKTVQFKNLYSGTNVPRRVLVIFIRHFFCGVSILLTFPRTTSPLSFFQNSRSTLTLHKQNCQEYLRTLTDSITTDELLALPTPTFIAVVGHGEPSLIPMYAAATHCPFPIYADPTKRLYNELGMVRTLNMGSRPEYQRRGTAKGMWQSVLQGVKNLKGGKALQGLDWHQVGGEFLFEPLDMSTPITTPDDELNRQLDGSANGYVEEKRITWCHRMKNTRDHAELPELRAVLGLDGAGNPGKDRKRWTKALGERKGTGLSGRTSSSTTRNGGSSGRESVIVEHEKATKTPNGKTGEGQSVADERAKATAALNGDSTKQEPSDSELAADKETK
jgi:hypothetical protein